MAEDNLLLSDSDKIKNAVALLLKWQDEAVRAAYRIGRIIKDVFRDFIEIGLSGELKRRLKYIRRMKYYEQYRRRNRRRPTHRRHRIRRRLKHGAEQKGFAGDQKYFRR